MKILVLAGGFDQIAFINELKHRGHEVYLADYLDNPPAKNHVIKHYQVSTLDEQAIYELASKENFDLITTACTDQALLTVARVSQKLKKYFYLDEDIAECVTNKSIMKSILRKNDIATARYVVVDESEKIATCDKIEHFPIMVKPCDCNSSKGVVKVNDKDELLAALNEAFILSRTNQAVIEEYIDGIEISIDAWVENGHAKVLSISKTNKIKENTNSFTIFQSEYPVILAENIKKQISCIAEQISKVFRLNNSPLLIQAIVSGDKLYVIEFSARMGGGSKYKLIEYMTGINIMEAYVNLILGSEYQIPEVNLSSKYIELGYVYCYNGTVARIIGFDKLKNAGVISEIFQYKLEGACIEKMVTSSDRILGFLIEADTKDCLLKKRKYILKQVDILGTHNQSLMFKKCFE